MHIMVHRRDSRQKGMSFGPNVDFYVESVPEPTLLCTYTDEPSPFPYFPAATEFWYSCNHKCLTMVLPTETNLSRLRCKISYHRQYFFLLSVIVVALFWVMQLGTVVASHHFSSPDCSFKAGGG